jgi:hypothetical protein
MENSPPKTHQFKTYLWPIAFYLVGGMLIVFFSKTPGFKSGPCTPGLDVLSWLLFGLVAFGLLVRSILIAIWRKKRDWISLLIHAAALIIWLIIASI